LFVQQIVKALEEKSVETENDISELKTDLEGLRMNFTLCNGRVKTNKERIEELEKSLAQ